MIRPDQISVGNGRPEPIYRPPARFDLLRVPGLGRMLKWRWGRLIFQIPLLLLAILLIYDGFTGAIIASQNLATVAAWIHYRGIIILVLLLVGNVFCMSCPFTIPRTIAHRLSKYGKRWPRSLRNKWLAIGMLVLIFFLYEWLDLWASPLLTAWVIIAYFVAAFALEFLFAESPFCKYVCPLGTFNFTSSTISPFQISVTSQDVCRTCVGKECVNGSSNVLGCGTELFAPQIKSNMDCVLCLDCARACPYDNVALISRTPTQELTSGSWSRRWDLIFLVLVFTLAGLSNAFGMVPPFFVLQQQLAAWLTTGSDFVLLLVIFGIMNVLLPLVLAFVLGHSSRWLIGKDEPLRVVVGRYIPALVPLAFGTWLAHYGFHFATGVLTIIPVFQNFLLDHSITLLGTRPAWQLGSIIPLQWIYPLQVVFVLVGYLASMNVAYRISQREFGNTAAGRRSLLPWMLLLIILTFTAMYMFNLPMEMRGTIQFGG